VIGAKDVARPVDQIEVRARGRRGNIRHGGMRFSRVAAGGKLGLIWGA
jgi:hypothetical protein